MKRVHWQRRILAALFITMNSVAVFGESIEERDWIRIESQNFSIFSLLSEKRSSELLRRLEVVHSMFLGIANESTQSEVPTVIFAVSKAQDFEDLGVDAEHYTGQFRPGIRRNVVLVRSSDNSGEAPIIIHEYVHYLLMNQSRFPFPKWYHEGYAEYLSESKLTGKYFEVGRSNRSRVYWLGEDKWLPMERILNSTDYESMSEEEIGMFYSQSWLLVHYLYDRPGREDYVVNGMRQYASSILQGLNMVDAFEAGFGMTVATLETNLRNYLKRGKFNYLRYPTAPLLRDFAPRSRKITRAEIAAELGTLALRQDRLDEAEQFFDTALTDSSTMAAAEMGLARVAQERSGLLTAEDFVTSAAALAPDNYYVQLDAAKYWLERASQSGLAADYSKSEQHLLQAFKINKTRPELLMTMGRFLLATNQDAERAIQIIETAAMKAPADQGTRLMLAQILLSIGRIEESIEYARDVIAFSHSSNQLTETAHELIVSAESYKFDHEDEK